MFVPSQEDIGSKLVRAARGGRTEDVIALLDQGADIEATDEVRHVMFLLLRGLSVTSINVRIWLSRLEVHANL